MSNVKNDCDFSQVKWQHPQHWNIGYVPEWAEYLAVDEDGSEYFYEFEPIKSGNGKWLPSTGRCLKRIRLISNWEDTLLKRPPRPITNTEKIKKKRSQNGRGRPKKRKPRKIKKLNLQQKLKKGGIYSVTSSTINQYHIRYIIVRNQNGVIRYCSGNKQDFFGVYTYRFVPKAKLKKVKFYKGKNLALSVIDSIVESGQGVREELSIELVVCSYKDGVLSKNHNGNKMYQKYLSIVEQHKAEKYGSKDNSDEYDDDDMEDLEDGGLEIDFTEQEEDGDESWDEGESECDDYDDFDE